jgi:outer membrane protein
MIPTCRIYNVMMLALFILLQGFFHVCADTQTHDFYTLNECIDTGLEKSTALHAVLMQTRAARARLGESYTSYLPAITTGFTYSRLSETDPFSITIPTMSGPVTEEISPSITESYTFSVSLKQPVFTGFRHVNNTVKSSHILESSLAEYGRSRLALISTIKKSYWSLVLAVETEKVIEENIVVMKAYLTDVKNLFGQGLVTNNEVLKAEIRFSQAEVMKTDVDNALQLARLQLSLVMGLDGKTPLFPKDSPYHEVTTGYNLDNLINLSLENRPEKKALRGQIHASKIDVRQAFSAWYPALYIIGNMAYAQPNTRYFPLEEEFKLSWDVGIYAGIDLSAWYSAPFKSEQAKARQKELEDTLEQLDNTIRIEVTRSYCHVKKAAEQIRTAGKILRQAEENQKNVEEKYKTGLSLHSEVLEAELERLQARLNLTQAKIEYERALIDLEQAVGMKPENEAVME